MLTTGLEAAGVGVGAALPDLEMFGDDVARHDEHSVATSTTMESGLSARIFPVTAAGLQLNHVGRPRGTDRRKAEPPIQNVSSTTL